MLLMSLAITSLVLITFNKINKIWKNNIDSFNDDASLYGYYDDTILENVATSDENHIKYIKRNVKSINEAQVIHNQHRFGKVKPTTYIIVIQVHSNIIYLKSLLQSLKFTMGITNSLLIFSHDYYDDDINRFIRNISFAKFTQIFYPYSTQLFPNAFPGNDGHLCTHDYECEKSAMRVESLAQKKHFWWWQTNYVFDRLKATENFNGTVVFLEEDQYVLKDFIFMLKVLESTMEKNYPQCEMIVLGAHTPAKIQFHTSDANLTVSSWDSLPYDMGIAFNRIVWNTMKEYSNHYCNFKDYRWASSLKFMGSKRRRGKFTVLSTDGPRVLRYKTCVDCVFGTFEKYIKDVDQFANTIRRGLFPRHVNIKIDGESDGEVTPAGYWEDVRDRGLCMHLVET